MSDDQRPIEAAGARAYDAGYDAAIEAPRRRVFQAAKKVFLDIVVELRETLPLGSEGRRTAINIEAQIRATGFDQLKEPQ